METQPIPHLEKVGINWRRAAIEVKAFAIESMVDAGIPPQAIIKGIIYTGNNPWNTTINTK